MLLNTKCFLPSVPQKFLQRNRLHDTLTDAYQNQVGFILVSAPPGYGKSSLLANWVQAENINCVWFSIEKTDNHTTQFLQYITHTLRNYLTNPDNIIASINGPQAISPHSIIIEIINQLIDCPKTVFLVLDDYHNIENPEINELVEFLINHIPPKLRVGLITRSDPPFRLSNLRARRQMIDIRQHDLSFSMNESDRLLREILGIPLSENNVTTLTSRTEGWVVGLHLAALSLKNHKNVDAFIKEFDGSHRFIIEYLASELVSSLDPDTREFLKIASIFNLFSAGLVNEVMSINTAEKMIKKIQKQNLFVISLDDNQEWFRLHHLIGDIFRSMLKQEEIRLAQTKAALWFNQQGMPIEAIHLAFEINDMYMVCDFVRESVIQIAEQGDLITALSWLDHLPIPFLERNSDLAVIRIWLLIYNGRFQDAFTSINQFENNKNFNLQELPAQVQSLLRGIKAWSRTIFGQKMDLAELQEAYKEISVHYPFFSPILLLALGQAQKESGLMNEALHSFRQGVAISEHAENPLTNLILRNNLAFLLNSLGKRYDAIKLCEEGITRHTKNDDSTLLAGIPMIPYGCLLYQNGELEKSEAVLTKSINYVDRLGLAEILTSPANQVLQFLYSDQGLFKDALALNQEARHHALSAGMPAVIQYLELFQAWIYFWHGEMQFVQQWIDQNPFDMELTKAARYLLNSLLHARVLANHGDTEYALKIISNLEINISSSYRVIDWIQIQINASIVLNQALRNQEAAEILLQAIQKAEPIMLRQVFLQELSSIQPILNKIDHFLPEWLKGKQINIITPKSNSELLINPPTDKEMEILRLVAGGLSNAQIADRLFITVGTTKWHMNHLFSKLGANRRTEAVVKAKEYGLL